MVGQIFACGDPQTDHWVWRIIAFAPCLPASCHWIGLSLFVGGGGLVADFGSGLGTFHLFPPTQLGLNSESELVIAHCTDNVYGLFDIMIWSEVFVYWYDHSWIKSEMINFASPLKYYSPILNLKPPRIWFHSSITDLATSASNSWFCFDEWNCNCVCAWCEQNWQLKPPVLMISIIWMKVNQNHTEAG